MGDTFKTTVSFSGSSPSSLSSTLYDASATVVSRATPVSSGNGCYYALHQLPTTPGQFASEWRAQVDSFTHIVREIVRVNDVQVD